MADQKKFRFQYLSLTLLRPLPVYTLGLILWGRTLCQIKANEYVVIEHQLEQVTVPRAVGEEAGGKRQLS